MGSASRARAALALALAAVPAVYSAFAGYLRARQGTGMDGVGPSVVRDAAIFTVPVAVVLLVVAVVVVATVPHEKRGGVAQAVLGASALCCLVQAFVYP